MHELPVVLDLIRVMEGEAQKHGFQKITQIDLVIGELLSIVDESVQMYFDIASKDTPCSGAKLVFEHRPAILKCQKCGRKFPHQRSFSCPECGGDSVLVKGTGREFYIRSYEGESPEPQDTHAKQEFRKDTR